MGAIARQCSFTRPDGEHCKARPLRGLPFCFFHDPSQATERKEACRAGGRANHVQGRTVSSPIAALSDAGDVVTILSDTMIRLRAGEIDPKIANTLGFLAGVLLKAFEHADAGKQIAELQRVLMGETLRTITHPELFMKHLSEE